MSELPKEEWNELGISGFYIDDQGRLWVRGEPKGGDCYEFDRMAIARLCLHGRITWEMVDSLRAVAPTLQKLSVRPVFPVDGEQVDMMRSVTGVVGKIGRQGDELARVADLLESLLPPRPQP